MVLIDQQQHLQLLYILSTVTVINQLLLQINLCTLYTIAAIVLRIVGSRFLAARCKVLDHLLKSCHKQTKQITTASTQCIDWICNGRNRVCSIRYEFSPQQRLYHPHPPTHRWL